LESLWPRLHAKPVLIVNLEGFYDAFLSMTERALTEGMLRPEHRGLVDAVATVEEAIASLPERLRAGSNFVPKV